MSPMSGTELAVFGSFFLGSADGAGVAGAAVGGGGAGLAAGGRAGAGAAAPDVGAAFSGLAWARVASTCRFVMTCGGFSVMIVAVSLLPARRSESWTGLPSFIIVTFRLSTSPCVNILNPSAVRTMMFGPTTCCTVPSLTSVTVTGFTVVVVVIVAVPDMPGFSS